MKRLELLLLLKVLNTPDCLYGYYIHKCFDDELRKFLSNRFVDYKSMDVFLKVNSCLHNKNMLTPERSIYEINTYDEFFPHNSGRTIPIERFLGPPYSRPILTK